MTVVILTYRVDLLMIPHDSIPTEKVILHPDLKGAPLLILANKQDLPVSTHPDALKLVPTHSDQSSTGCLTTDKSGECFQYWHRIHRGQRL